jgi:hypothetical protein
VTGTTERIDPRALKEPWSRFVSRALRSRHRFEDVVRSAQPGPMRARLAAIAVRLDDAIREGWHVAQRGNAVTTGVRSLRLDRVRSKLTSVYAQQEGGGAQSASLDSTSLDSTARSLQAQLEAGERLAQVSSEARKTLELLGVRLEEVVARAIELSLQTDDGASLHRLDGDVESLVSELGSLRHGLDARTTANEPRP